MVDQTTVRPPGVEGNGGPRPFPPRAVARNMADLGHDVTTLAELQLRLLSADCRDAARRIALPSVAAVAGLVLALCTMPILLAAIALGLGEVIPLWASFLITAVVFLGISGALLAVAYVRLRRSLIPLERSQKEFQQNVRWLKTVLRHMGTRGVPHC